MITHYLKVAVRNLLKYKSQNLISIVGLAVGLCCFCICFYISRFIGSVDKCFENYERIAEVYLVTPEGRTFSGTSGKLLPELRQRDWNGVEAFTVLAKPESKEYNAIQENGEALPYRLTRMETDSLYFKVFTPTVLTGNWEQVTHNRNSIVLTEHTAKKMYQEIHQAIGKQIILPNKQFTNGSVTYTVQAVIKDLPENTSMNFMRPVDMLTVNDEDGYESLPNPDILFHHIYALLHKDYTAKDLSQSFQNADYKFYSFGNNNPVQAKPLGEDANHTQIAQIMNYVTGIIGLLILLAASLNFFHFQAGSFLNRGREFSIRKILGNNTSGLFWMQFIQITIIILTATVISGCLIEMASPLLHISLFRFSIQMEKGELLTHLIQYMGGLLLLNAIVALGIALYIRRSTMRISLNGLGNVNGKKHLRNILLGVQFFICWLFVSTALGLYLQSEKTSSVMFNTLTKQEKGNIITIPLDHEFLSSDDRQFIINSLRQHADIKDMLFLNCRFLSNRMTSVFDSPTREKHFDVRILNTTPNLAEFLNVNLEGTGIQKENEIWISRNLATQLKDNPIGKSLYNYKKGFVISGVLDDITNYVYSDGYGLTNYGTVYYLIDEFTEGFYCYVKCYPGKTNEVKTWIEDTLRKVFPSSIEPKISTLQKDIEENQALENKLKEIILFFSIVCLIITLLGVYSAITLDTERRQKEVAIRKVNGAGLKDIILLFARLYVWVLGVSFVVAAPIVYLILHIWKQMYLVFFNDGILYWGGILLGVTSITALTVIFRILKIARVNPATIIKSE